MILRAHMSDVSVRINIGTFSAILVGSEMQNGVFILIGTHEGNVFLQVMNSRFCVQIRTILLKWKGWNGAWRVFCKLRKFVVKCDLSHFLFFCWFFQIQVQWLTMVLVMKTPKKCVNATDCIFRQICVICIILSMHHFILSTFKV